jgi:hypothetical protein
MEAAADPLFRRLEVERPVGEAAGQLSDYSVDLWVTALHFGAALGYALARSAPSGLGEFDGWLERAKLVAAFDDRAPDRRFAYPEVPAAWREAPPAPEPPSDAA